MNNINKEAAKLKDELAAIDVGDSNPGGPKAEFIGKDDPVNNDSDSFNNNEFDEQGANSVDDVVLWSTIWQIGGELLAVRRGPHWKLSETESRELAHATIPIADKYLPAINANIEMVFAMQIGQKAMPRLQQDIENMKAFAEAMQASEDGQTGSDSAPDIDAHLNKND